MRIRMSGGVGRVIREDGPYPISALGALGLGILLDHEFLTRLLKILDNAFFGLGNVDS